MTRRCKEIEALEHTAVHLRERLSQEQSRKSELESQYGQRETELQAQHQRFAGRTEGSLRWLGLEQEAYEKSIAAIKAESEERFKGVMETHDRSAARQLEAIESTAAHLKTRVAALEGLLEESESRQNLMRNSESTINTLRLELASRQHKEDPRRAT